MSARRTFRMWIGRHERDMQTMQIGRRSFLGNGMALFGSAAAGALKAQATAKRHTERPRVRIGVIADPHIGTEWMMGINSPATEKAFRDFRAQDVDAVAVLGDFTNSGTIAQLEAFARIWYEVFPNDMGLNGKKVEKLFVTGNHDPACWRPPEKQNPETHIAPRMAEHWRRCFHEDYAPAWRKEINGFQFTGINWGIHPKKDIKDAYRREDLEPVFKEAFARAKPGEPVFHIQHAPPPKTCYCSGASYGTAEQLFGGDERLFMLTGHLHKPLTHPKNIWQGSYTLVSAGVITWASFPPFGWPKDLPGGAAYAKSQCTVSVYQDEIVVERKSTWSGERLGDDWRIPLPLKRETFPYTNERMTARAKAPFFPAEASVAANVGMGENVFWKVPPNRKAVQGKGGIVLTFPAADIDSGEDMVMCYEATATRADDGQEVATQKFFTEFFMGRRYMRNTYEVLFDAERLPEGVPCRFTVRAVDFFDRKSEPIVSEPIAFKRYI